MANKVWRKTTGFERKLHKLEKKGLYSIQQFETDVVEFLLDEKNIKFRKHDIVLSANKKVFSISLGYDLRALYFFVKIEKNTIIEYVFFDIGDHNEIY